MSKLKKRKLTLAAIDLCILAITYAVAFWLSWISRVRVEPLSYLMSFALTAIMMMAARMVLRVYRNIWRYANARAYLDIVMADAIGGGVAVLLEYILHNSLNLPLYIGAWVSISVVAVANCCTLISRFVYQQLYSNNYLNQKNAECDTVSRDRRINVAIVGAGRVGALLAEELLCYEGSYYRPVCFIDNSPVKLGGKLAGLPVYADDESVFERLKHYPVQEIIIAIPQLGGDRAHEMFKFYARSGCKVKLYDFPRHEMGQGNDEGSSQKRVIREFKIEDLLFRNSIKVTDEGIGSFYEGRCVLVTGGGGSIGSELVRQIAKCKPRKLVIFDIYENNAYDIQQELVRRYGDALDLAVEIGSVRDRERLDAVFAAYRPDIVFHAAAHKHVPLMEHSNCEAIKNNVIGTYNTADMAEKYGVKKFILISTDKAVNPTNVMGASKRMCEMVIQCRTDSETVFSAVRFGNVLGSNGSVIPLFKRQIAAGGPITLTDMRIIRYFMTIPEAAGLVITAGAMARKGELFVLDMGKPVKIYDLAENMIKLSGLRPGEDIKIIETGLRPGEKLYEELLIKTETLTKTDNDLIFIEKDTPLSRAEVEEKLAILREAVVAAQTEIAPPSITEAMRRVVPTFHSPEEINKRAERSEEMRAVVV